MSSRCPEPPRLAWRRPALPALALAALAALAPSAASPGAPPAPSGRARAGSRAEPASRAAPAARELRVCADPNNLPFSNDRGEGFENKLAEIVAREAGAALRYTWWAQRRGFFRNTLKAGACDVVMGVPSGFEMALTTRPYYRSTYAFVSRQGGPRVRSLDDPALRLLRVGVQLVGDDGVNTPPVHALSRRGVVDNVVGFSLYGDYARPNPPAAAVEAVASGRVDVAIVWGPLAGYFARGAALELDPVAPAEDGPLPFAFDITVGVRKGDRALRDELEGILERRRDEVRALLDAYGVPRAPAARGPSP